MRILIALVTLFLFGSISNAERIVRTRTVTTTVERNRAVALNAGIRSGFRGERFDGRTGYYGGYGLTGLSLSYAAPPSTVAVATTSYAPVPSVAYSVSAPSDPNLEARLARLEALIGTNTTAPSQVILAQQQAVYVTPAPTYYVQYGVPYYGNGYGGTYGTGFSGFRTGFYGVIGRGFSGFRGGFNGRRFR